MQTIIHNTSNKTERDAKCIYTSLVITWTNEWLEAASTGCAGNIVEQCKM